MKWRSSDLKQYQNAKEYIDTVIIPIIPFQIDLEMLAFQSEVLTIFANEIEKELAGRVMLMPTYSYLKTVDPQSEINRINAWIANIKEQPFTNVFLLTFDANWKKNEKEVHGHLLWLPSVKSGNLQSNEMKAMIRDQTNQIIELIQVYW
ncbi:DUF2487 domain-containing protein [Oceanobacillus arenosus]|uniref:DUF2487 domain-containing protein n=1 Tax=Oceanobacillus arenosus TaxID=1229153 RepID=A0A3D8PSH0_9BACI|nr:YpiF family protein [Oceanobacillus arenosus]RDW19063.1 DUF2487 domain-containing protein [Oceanobacillus arenosus]